MPPPSPPLLLLSSFLLSTHLQLAASVACPSVTQVHLAGGAESATSMTVSYTSPKECDSAVNFGLSATDLSSSASNPSGPSQYTHTSKDFGSYTSNYLHHITLTGLSPATTYHYGIPTCSEFANICSPADAVFSFTTAPLPGAAFPTKFAIVGDLGQTANSLSTVMHIHEDSDVAAILHAGDMSYSDCEQPRWDSWFSMIEFLAVSTPWYVCVGNHEVEYDVATGETFRPYEARFRMPQVHEEPEYHEAKTEDQSCCPSEGEYVYVRGRMPAQRPARPASVKVC